MRRKSGSLIPLEESIIEAAKQLRQEGIEEFYGFQISKKIEEARLSVLSHPPPRLQRLRAIVGYGTLYRALSRLQKMGVLQSRWEELPVGENRPRRRYYSLVSGSPYWDKPKKETRGT